MGGDIHKSKLQGEPLISLAKMSLE